MSKTDDNLKISFSSKSQTNQKYRAYSKKARSEGLPNIARLFKLTSESEKIQAEGSLAALAGIGTTLDNLKAAIAGKRIKYRKAYPEMVKQAISDNHRAKSIFQKAVKIEQVQTKLYMLAFEALKEGKDLTQSEFFFCPRCGNIKLGLPDENCNICESAPGKFIRVGAEEKKI